MSVEFHHVYAKYSSVEVKCVTSKDETFYVRITSEGLEFYSDVSSSGVLYSNPVVKTADDLLNWVGNEGLAKPFRKRKQVRPRVTSTDSKPANFFVPKIKPPA